MQNGLGCAADVAWKGVCKLSPGLVSSGHIQMSMPETFGYWPLQSKRAIFIPVKYFIPGALSGLTNTGAAFTAFR